MVYIQSVYIIITGMFRYVGWPNRPGRPELINFLQKNLKFELMIMVHPPDYLAGLAIEDLSYNIFLTDSWQPLDVDFLQTTVNSSIAREGVSVQLDLTNDLNKYQSIYYLAVSINYTNRMLSNIIVLPGFSPYLRINAICIFFC